MHILHPWEFLETFITEGRQLERQQCTKCEKTRITIPRKLLRKQS